jgi:uncharacterized protein Yka (UPF0111/DUF47 family)
MLSIQSFFSKSNTFADLYTSSADEVRKSVTTLIEILKSPAEAFNLENFSKVRQQNKRINGEITTLLCQTFVTPLEREDMEALSRALYRIPKTLEKFAARLTLTQAYLPADFFNRQAKILEEAAVVVHEMVRQLWHHPNLEKIKEENDRLHALEGEADKLAFGMLRELYSGKFEPLQVIVLRDLLELLEKVIDRCRDAGNVIFHIILKNS